MRKNLLCVLLGVLFGMNLPILKKLLDMTQPASNNAPRVGWIHYPSHRVLGVHALRF